jgi:Mg2+ and Co2+ transporter CorA
MSNIIPLQARNERKAAATPDIPSDACGLNFPDFPSREERAAQRKAEREELRAERAARRKSASMHTFCFRSYDMIVESDEADLVRDVSLDVHKAQVKLRKIRERLQSVQEQAAAQVKLLTAADNKLSAAIEAALSSTRGTSED